MKKLNLLLLATFVLQWFSANGYSQSVSQNGAAASLISSKGTTVNVIDPQKFHLNSKGKTMLAGKDRISLQIDLPENTVEWYYYVCASNEGSARNIQLAAQIGTLIVKKRATVSQIEVKTGSSYCNVYVLADELSRSKFESRRTPFNYIESVSRNNFSSGVVKCTGVDSRRVWLAIENTRKMHAVDVNVEVVAVVQ